MRQMNGQHFKELVNTVCKTTGCTKKHVAFVIGVAPSRVNVWERQGVPVHIKPYVISMLKQILFSNRSETVN